MAAGPARVPADERRRFSLLGSMYRLFYWMTLSLAAAWVIFAAYEAVRGF
jgi:hypothetical protein